MREIKFRCWYDNRMYKVVDIDFAYERINLRGADIIGFEDGKLMQYIGLLDKNGKRIYEGDIVRDMEVYLTHQSYVKQEIESVQEAGKYRYFGNVAVLEFCTQEIASCGCCYQEFVGTGFKAKRVDLTCCEVIGNIYDNPELLEKGKE